MLLHLITHSPEPPGFLQESDGSGSAMRLMCLIALGASIVFGGMTLLVPKAAGMGLTVTTLFLTASFSGKLIQKTMENPSTPG